MPQFDDKNRFFKAIRNKVSDIMEDKTDAIGDAVKDELQKAWDAYMLKLKSMDDDDRMKLGKKYGIKSFEKIDIKRSEQYVEDIGGISQTKIKIGVLKDDRLRDVRILEFIFSSITPFRTTLAKSSNPASIRTMLGKRKK